MAVKAQVSVISIILISGIIISLVGASYMWGVPLIEKRTIITEFSNGENFVKSANDAVINIVNTGSGKETLDIPTGSVEVIPDSAADENKNSIILNLGINQPFVFGTEDVYLGEASFNDIESEVGVYGESSPSIISLTSKASGTGYIVPIKLHFRELDTVTAPKKGYKIIIKTVDGGKKTGTGKLSISYGGIENLRGQAANGGDLIVTNVLVQVF